MSKGEFLIIRADRAFKERLEQTAKGRGLSMTTFVVETLEKEMRRAGAARPPARTFGGVPSFFLATCQTASQGGTRGYDGAGWNLGIHVAEMLEPQEERSVVQGKLRELRRLLTDQDDDGVLAWFDREFPKCMALIPRRKRMQFLVGVYGAHEDRDITR